MGAGTTRTYQVSVALPPGQPRLGPVDVLFLFDHTSSMGNVIASVISRSRQVLEAVRAQNPDSRFAVASFGDYEQGADMVWRLHVDMTADLGAIGEGLRKIVITNGVDYPEAYGRGLYESLFIGWREGSQKYIVLFGDAPAHDPSQFGANLGIDLGRDGKPGTSDDLRIAAVVSALAARGIHVLTIYDRGGFFTRKPMQDETRASMTFIAQGTGGATQEVEDSADIPDRILAQLRKIPPGPAGLLPPERLPAWLQVASTVVTAGPGTGQFEVRATTSVDAPAGATYSGALSVVDAETRSAVPLASSGLEVRVPQDWWVILKLLLPKILRILLPLLLAILLLRWLARWLDLGRRYTYRHAPSVRMSAWVLMRPIVRVGIAATLALCAWLLWRRFGRH